MKTLAKIIGMVIVLFVGYALYEGWRLPHKICEGHADYIAAKAELEAHEIGWDVAKYAARAKRLKRSGCYLQADVLINEAGYTKRTEKFIYRCFPGYELRDVPWTCRLSD